MNWMKRLFLIFSSAFLILLAGIQFISEFQPQDVSLFSDAFITLIQHFASIGLFLLIVWQNFTAHPQQPDSSAPKTAFSGWLSFLTLIALCILTVIVINPRGLYGVRLFPQLANALKQDKIQYYWALDAEPEVIILGSSRTLTISPAYIQQSLGLKAFNFGFSGVSPNELFLLSDLIFSDNKPVPPSVVVFDLSPSDIAELRENDLAEIPIEFLPYMSVKKAAAFLLDRYLQLFNLHQFSEAVYVLQYVKENQTPQNYWEIRPDGYSIFLPPDNLTQALKRQLKQRETMVPCQYFNKKGDQVIRKYVALSHQKNFSVVFYYSPVHPVFRENYLEKHEHFERCESFFLDLMATLVEENENIFFVDISHPETINLAIDDTGFYDGFHITPASAEKLIDYLAPTIQQAYQTSAALRESQP